MCNNCKCSKLRKQDLSWVSEINYRGENFYVDSYDDEEETFRCFTVDEFIATRYDLPLSELLKNGANFYIAKEVTIVD